MAIYAQLLSHVTFMCKSKKNKYMFISDYSFASKINEENTSYNVHDHYFSKLLGLKTGIKLT